jgi:hypothetical protein
MPKNQHSTTAPADNRLKKVNNYRFREQLVARLAPDCFNVGLNEGLAAE